MSDMGLVQVWQKEKGRLEDRPSAIQRPERRRQELTRLIENAFKVHFGLITSRAAHNFFLDCAILRQEFYFDHCSFYKKPMEGGTAFLVTSQPYDFSAKSRAYVERLAQEWNATFIDTSMWGWWYPGRTSSFTLCFPRATVERIRKDRRRRF